MRHVSHSRGGQMRKASPIRPQRYRLPALLLAVAIAVAGLGLHVRAAPVDARITLDPSSSYQVMTGWEATANLIDMNSAEARASRAGKVRMAVEDAGINRVRLELTAGAENRLGKARDFAAGRIDYKHYKPFRYRIQNDNDDPFVIDPGGYDFSELDWHVENTVNPMRKLLAAKGEKLVVNLCYVAFGDGRTIHMQPEEYAELMLAAFQHLRDRYGFVPDLIEVMLEPDLDHGWTGRDMGLAMVATARRLAAADFHPGFVVPSVTNMSHALPYMREILAVEGTAPLIREVSYHRYKGANPRTLAAIADQARRIGAQTSMLEWWFGKGTYKVLLEDLSIGNTAAWQGRAVDGLVEEPADDTGALRLRPEVAFNAQYFRTIRLGSRRIGAGSSDPAIVPLAFVAPDGRTVVILTASRNGRAHIEGLPPGRYRVTGTIEGKAAFPDQTAATEGGRLDVGMPGAGVYAIAPD